MRKRIIVHLFPTESWGGAEIQMVDLAGWQREAGVDARIWCKADSPIEREAKRRNIPLILDPFPMRAVFPQLAVLRMVLKREGATHLHVHWAAGIRLVYGIKYFVNVALIFYTHMWITRSKKDLFHRLAYHHFDKATVSGERAYENVLKFLPWRKSQLERCPYGIDFRLIPDSLRANHLPTAEVRRKFNIPERALVFAFFGRIDRQKGLKEFLLGAEPIMVDHENLHLMVVGDPTINEEEARQYSQEIDEIVESSRFKDRIHRFSHQHDVHPALACANLAVLPSYMECYSILIVLCFAHGIPVVSTQAGGTPDLVAPPRRGWLVPSRDITALQDQLLAIVERPGDIIAKAEECIRYARSAHSHQVVVERMNEIYRMAERTNSTADLKVADRHVDRPV